MEGMQRRIPSYLSSGEGSLAGMMIDLGIVIGWAGNDLLDLAVNKALDKLSPSAERLTKSAFCRKFSI